MVWKILPRGDYQDLVVKYNFFIKIYNEIRRYGDIKE